MILLTTALGSEARPLIKHFNLKQIDSFPIYEESGLRLVVTGVGKINAAMGIGYAWNDKIMGVLNVGIAGHKKLPIGTAILADKVKDPAMRKSFFPTLVFEPPCRTKGLITVDLPEKKYDDESCYDMEAAGICLAASRFLSFEMIHCLKIISDNQHFPTETVTKESVEKLLTAECETIEKVLLEMQRLHGKIQGVKQKRSELEELLRKWYFTHTEKKRLEKLTNRIYAINPFAEIDVKKMQHCKDAKHVLSFLEELLCKMPFTL